jgi:hypothetical protein
MKKTVDIKAQVGDQYIGLECATKRYILHWSTNDGPWTSQTLVTQKGYNVRSLKVAMKRFNEAVEAAKIVKFTNV